MSDKERRLQLAVAIGSILMGTLIIHLTLSSVMYAAIRGDFSNFMEIDRQPPEIWAAVSLVITLALSLGMITLLVDATWYRWLMAVLIGALALFHATHIVEEVTGNHIQGWDYAIHSAHTGIGLLTAALAILWARAARHP